MRINSAATVRCYLSEASEKTVLQLLKKQLCCQKHVTSDDVRSVVRAVASQGGTVTLPLDFPSSRWVLEFKRIHGFMQLSNFALNVVSSGGNLSHKTKATIEAERPARQNMALVSSHKSRTTTSILNLSRMSNNANEKHDRISQADMVQTTDNDLRSGNLSDDEKEMRKSEECVGARTSESTRMVMYSMIFPECRVSFDGYLKRQVKLRHSFGQRHQHHLQQQQRRAMLVEDRRRATTWSIPVSQLKATHEVMQSEGSSGKEPRTAMGQRSCQSRSNEVGSGLGPSISLMTPHIQHSENSYDSNGDRIHDMVPSTTLINDNRGYKLSHTVPAVTWEKAIAAVEQQGMSLRAAAKLFGVHFAALHRRVKKRAQSGKDKGTNGYFHPSDEAGIMRVVVARAELGVLMTFAELMRLVEAAALRKLPDLSIEGARNLLTRFQSRNADSIRHIIDDWPLPRLASSAIGDDQIQPYTSHPGFDFGSAPTRSAESTVSSNTLVAPAVYGNSGNDPGLSEVRLIDTMRNMGLGTIALATSLSRLA